VLLWGGVGTWIGVGTWTSTSALADSTVNPLAMMMSGKDLPTSHYARPANRQSERTSQMPFENRDNG
jgi:hypothetical protein